MLRGADTPHAKSTLKRELAALLAIQNERIPRLYDWSLAGAPTFAALEYFPAGSLADAWPFIGRFDEEQTWRLLSDLLAALTAAHRAGILHLDVKPSNVLLDGNGGFVLTDFGVAQAARMTPGQMQLGHLLVGAGTHGYRAPEQGKGGGAYDMRTDLFGVGATAWALYTGIDLNKRPETRRKQAGNVYGLPSLSEVRLHCPRLLEELVMGLLAIDPALRPGGAAEVMARLRSAAEGLGFDAITVAAAHSANASSEEVAQLVASLVDPLWASLCRAPGFERYIVKFDPGEVICGSGVQTHHTYVLLSGTIRVERDGETVEEENQEGTFLGHVSTLTGAAQEVTLRASTTVWACIFNEAELEQLVTCNPALAVRMIRGLATRVADSPRRGLA